MTALGNNNKKNAKTLQYKSLRKHNLNTMVYDQGVLNVFKRRNASTNSNCSCILIHNQGLCGLVAQDKAVDTPSDQYVLVA